MLARARRTAGLLALVVASCAAAVFCAAAPASERPAPEFALKDAAGKTVTRAELRGRAVLLDFWAPWCDSCREAAPYYQKLQERRGSGGLTVVGIDEDESARDAAAFAKAHGLTYPILFDARRKAFDAYGVRELPTVVLLDADGKIRGHWAGFDRKTAADVAKAVDALLAPNKPAGQPE